MALDYERLMSGSHPDKEFTYTERDTMLYALGIGLGRDPLDRQELPFVFERGLKVMPTQATVIAWDDSFVRQSGGNVMMMVHGEQKVTLHRPLPPAATVVASLRVSDVFDKGPGRGALLLTETLLREKATNELLCTNHSTVFARGDGGFGGPAGSGPAPHPLPERAPDNVCELATRPDQAFLYALSGDRNPLHRDPEFAAGAGFPRPILHGLCTYGVACHAVVKTLCGYEPNKILDFAVRFSAPLFPGETVRTEMWQEGGIVSFRAVAAERDVVVLNNGKATLAA